jgi:hypothetical protein
MNNTFDFFGINKKKRKAVPNGPFFFLGKPTSRGLAPSTINPISNYWGTSSKSMKYGNPLYRKESLRQKKKLSKWGDVDMDGSPNYFDCDPVNFLKDAKKIKRKAVDNMGEDETKNELKRLMAKQSSKSRKEFEVRQRFKELTKPQRKVFTLSTPAIEQLKGSIEEKLSQRKMPKAKDITRYRNIQEKSFTTESPNYRLVTEYKNKQVMDEKGKPIRDKKTGKIITKRVKVGEKLELVSTEKRLKNPMGIAIAVKERTKAALKGGVKMLEETYGKKEQVRTAKVKRLVKGGLGAVFGPNLLNPQTSPKGRPRGPSGTYKIQGKPVFEEEYQKWVASQRAMNRITPSVAQEAPITPEEMQNMVAQPSNQSYTAEQQIEQMAMAQPKNEQQFANGNVPMTPGEIEASKYREEVRRGPTNEEVKMAQEIAQKQDNVLNAPSFMKGELKATGGSLLTTTGPQIMDAPNAFKGELRNLNRGDPASMGEVKLGERPQTNPYGDEYIDIELGSGRPVLKKRPREKWVTGEAL